MTVIGKHNKLMVISLLSLYLINIIAFIVLYYGGVYSNDTYQAEFNIGLDQALGYANKINDNENIYISMCINQPYIYILFDNPASPYDFTKEVQYYSLSINREFTEVKKMGIYVFYLEEEANNVYKPNQVYLLNKATLQKDVENGYLNGKDIKDFRRFGNFVVFKT